MQLTVVCILPKILGDTEDSLRVSSKDNTDLDLALIHDLVMKEFKLRYEHWEI